MRTIAYTKKSSLFTKQTDKLKFSKKLFTKICEGRKWFKELKDLWNWVKFQQILCRKILLPSNSPRRVLFFKKKKERKKFITQKENIPSIFFFFFFFFASDWRIIFASPLPTLLKILSTITKIGRIDLKKLLTCKYLCKWTCWAPTQI